MRSIPFTLSAILLTHSYFYFIFCCQHRVAGTHGDEGTGSTNFRQIHRYFSYPGLEQGVRLKQSYDCTHQVLNPPYDTEFPGKCSTDFYRSGIVFLFSLWLTARAFVHFLVVWGWRLSAKFAIQRNGKIQSHVDSFRISFHLEMGKILYLWPDSSRILEVFYNWQYWWLVNRSNLVPVFGICLQTSNFLVIYCF